MKPLLFIFFEFFIEIVICADSYGFQKIENQIKIFEKTSNINRKNLKSFLKIVIFDDHSDYDEFNHTIDLLTSIIQDEKREDPNILPILPPLWSEIKVLNTDNFPTDPDTGNCLHKVYFN